MEANSKTFFSEEILKQICGEDKTHGELDLEGVCQLLYKTPISEVMQSISGGHHCFV